MKLFVNGQEQDVEGPTLAEALVALAYEDANVATALNGEFVPKRARAVTPVCDGDRIEILAPRQGG
jgi:sulfur carrier protein